MKKIFIMLLSLGSVAFASAQSYDHNYRGYDRDRDRDIARVDNNRYDNFGDHDRDGRISEINREYDHRIWEVRNDYRLSPRQQRRMIRGLNEEREMRIREMNRWRNNRHERVGVGVTMYPRY